MAEINVCYQCCLLEMVAFEVQITQFLYWKSLSLLYRQNPGRRAQHYFHNWIFQFSSTERYQPQCIICLQAKAQENFECLRSLLLPSLPPAPPPLLLQDFPELYNCYVLAFCRNVLELLQISSLQNWQDIFSSGDPSQPLLIPMITDRIRLHSVLFRPLFIAWNMSVYV